MCSVSVIYVVYIHYAYKVFVLLFVEFFRALARFPTRKKLRYLWLHKTNLTLWLSKHFGVIKVNYRLIWDAFKIAKVVLKSDVSFSWFAGGHAFLAVLFSKIFRNKSIVIAGGGDVAAVPEIDYGGMRRNKRSRYFAKFVLKHADVVLAVFTDKSFFSSSI